MLWIAHLQIIKVHKPQLSPKFKPDKIGTLNGDFSPLQAKHFFKKMIYLYTNQIHNLALVLLSLEKKAIMLYITI